MVNKNAILCRSKKREEKIECAPKEAKQQNPRLSDG
jgi:hypothetical protein